MATAPLPSTGFSKRWTGSKLNVLSIFNTGFRLHSEENQKLYPQLFEELPEHVLCSPNIWERIARYLVEQHQKQGGGFFDYEVAVNHLGTMLNMAAELHKTNGTPATRRFFDCLDPKLSSDSGTWLTGLKKNMRKLGYDRAVADGRDLDKSAKPIGRNLVELIMGQLAKMGTPAAALHAFGILALWLAAGRSSETACLSYDSVDWDYDALCLQVAVGQTKVAKSKLIAIVAGARKELCFFLHWGDYQVLQQQKARLVAGEKPWVTPELLNTNSPNQVLGDWIKELLPRTRGGNGSDGFSVPQLPLNPSAAGLRHGVIELLARHVPADFAVHMTGHEMRDISAFWNYLGADLSLCLPAAVVLAGWPAFKRGELGEGPSPPSLTALETIGVTVKDLDTTVDKFFRIDDASPPHIKIDGTLRMLPLTAFASQVMFYEERYKEHEMRPVRSWLHTCLTRWFGVGDPHGTLLVWSKMIYNDFNVKNLPSEKPVAGREEQMDKMCGIIGELAREKAQQTRQMLALQNELQHMKSLMEALVRQGGQEEMGSSSTQVPASPSPRKKRGKTPPSTPQQAEQPAGLESHLAPSPSGVPCMGGLMPMTSTAVEGVITSESPPTTFDKLSAATLFLWMSANQGANPPLLNSSVGGNASRCTDIYSFMQAMCNDNELKVLAEKIEEGRRRTICDYIGNLLRARLAAAFVEDCGVNLPRALRDGNVLGASAVENRQRELKAKHKFTLMPDKDAFKVWREAHEASSAKNKEAAEIQAQNVAGTYTPAGEAKKRASGGGSLSGKKSKK